MLKHNKKGALVFIDFDGFKTVNDTYGHRVGDELLTLFGKRLLDYLSHNNEDKEVLSFFNASPLNIFLSCSNPSLIKTLAFSARCNAVYESLAQICCHCWRPALFFELTEGFFIFFLKWKIKKPTINTAINIQYIGARGHQ